MKPWMGPIWSSLRPAWVAVQARAAHQLWLMLNGGPDSGLADGFVAPIMRTIHTPSDTADKLEAGGMTLAYNVVMGLVLELDRRTE